MDCKSWKQGRKTWQKGKARKLNPTSAACTIERTNFHTTGEE